MATEFLTSAGIKSVISPKGGFWADDEKHVPLLKKEMAPLLKQLSTVGGRAIKKGTLYYYKMGWLHNVDGKVDGMFSLGYSKEKMHVCLLRGSTYRWFFELNKEEIDGKITTDLFNQLLGIYTKGVGELLPVDVLVEIREEDLESVETIQKLFKEKIKPQPLRTAQPPRIDVTAQPKNKGLIVGVLLAALLVGVLLVAYRMFRRRGQVLPISQRI